MSPSEASDTMQLWLERSEGYNFSNLTSEASLITGMMSPKDSDD